MSEPGCEAGPHPLAPIFQPRSVAVVGASTDHRKRGNRVLVALREGGYAGSVYPVNPRGGVLRGHRVHTSIESLPEAPDLALVCRPAEAVPEVVAECGRRGIAGAVVLAVGFGESGEEGERLARATLEEARRFGVRIVGPNTSGILNAHTGLNLIGWSKPAPGRMALLVQSGNIALEIANTLCAGGGEGISICVGLGNRLDVGFAECLDYLAHDPATEAILVHAEGLGDARKFIRVAARVSRRKPVVAILGGRSREGRKAAISHTGSLGGSHELLRTGLEQAGVTLIDRTDEIVPVLTALAGRPNGGRGGNDGSGGRAPDDAPGVLVLTDGGGQATLAADLLSELGVPQASLLESTRLALRRELGPAAAVGNPVDVAGAADTDPEAFARTVRVLAEDPGVGVLLVIGLFGGYSLRFSSELADAEDRAARVMVETAGRSRLPVVVHSTYARNDTPPLRTFAGAGVPVVESLEVAVRAAAELWRRGEALARPPWQPLDAAMAGGRRSRPRPSHGGAVRSERRILTEPEAADLLSGFGLVFPRRVVCRSAGELPSALAELGCPVVLKAVSAHLPHKTEAGAVVTDIGSPAEAERAFKRIVADAGAHLARRPPTSERKLSDRPEIEEVLVARMLASPVAELLIGVRRDEEVGPVLTLGAGGRRAEALGDVVHRLLPLEEEDLRAMIRSLRVSRVLKGYRGGPAADETAIIRAAQGLAASLAAREDLLEAEINPLFALPDRAVAADALVVLRSE
ncbi:MAG: acetate--CoA ligase family protein [Gemmatimonadetes bacterium]|nr:acetate--CoA ligase family protein [Gemmatimonadota bacterium]